MKITKIKIRNLFGVREINLDGSDIELTGGNGVGKSSVIDAIRYALTNSSNRDCIIRKGESEGEILIETDNGVSINRKKRETQADYKSVKECGRAVDAPESFLRTLFSPLQINPVEFLQMPKAEQNRQILNLIDFKWDTNWIIEQFGELPPGINYEQNILQVLSDIQAENSIYFQRRQDINRDIRNCRAFIDEIAAGLPSGYRADYWRKYDIDGKYKELSLAQERNARINSARAFISDYAAKKQTLAADSEIEKTGIRREFSSRREELAVKEEQLRNELLAVRKEMQGLEAKMRDKLELADNRHENRLLKLDSDIGVAKKYIEMTPLDTDGLSAEIEEAKANIRCLNEYDRMVSMQDANKQREHEAGRLTEKIEIARTLPGQILATAKLPIDGLTIADGVPLIDGLPVSNLSDGEKLRLCVRVATAKKNSLQLVLIDGAERLSEENRQALYRECRDNGVQFIASRTTNAAELEVAYLGEGE